MKFLFSLIAIFNFTSVFSQDSVQINNLLNQSKLALKNGDVISAKNMAYQSYSLSVQKNNFQGISTSSNQLASIFESQSNYDSANYYLEKGMLIGKKYALKDELAATHNLMGLILWHQSRYKEALPNHAISLNLFQETNNKKGLADTYSKIGNVFYDLSDFPKALENFLQSLKTYSNLKDSLGIADVCNYLGKVYNRLNEKESAKKYLFKALSLHQRLNNNRGIAISYNGLGNLFMDNHDLIKALKFFEKSKDYHLIGGDQIGISISYINIGTIYDMMSSLSNDSLSIVAANINYQSKNPIKKSIIDSAKYYFIESIKINSKVQNQFGLVY